MKVHEVLRMLQNDGWALVATRGSDRQFRHASKPGRVTVPGEPRDDVAPGAGTMFFGKRVRSEVNMRYATAIEKAEGNLSAYVPDLPGCVVTGATVDEVESEIRWAIASHVDGLRADGFPVPPGDSQVEYVEVAAHLVIPSDGFAARQVQRHSA